jgi:threonine/homoserine/homoserine lactone efflux protein
VQVSVALTVNGMIVLSAGSLTVLLAKHPRAERVQRVTSGTLLASLAVRVALDRSRAVALP